MERAENGRHTASTQTVQMGANPWPKETWQTSHNMEGIVRRDIDTIHPGWTVEEVKVAARDRRLWSHFLCQAAGANGHDAVW